MCTLFVCVTIQGYFLSNCQYECELFTSIKRRRGIVSHTIGTLAFWLFLNTKLLSLCSQCYFSSIFISSSLLFFFWFFFPFLFVPFILSLSYQYSSVFALSLFPTFSILFISPLRYHSLLLRADERRRRLLQRYNEFLLAYEAGDMLDWIQEKKAENTGVELDDVWELQKKFDEFQMVRKSCLL